LAAQEQILADVGVSNSGQWRHSVGKSLGQPAARSVVAEPFE
jgi:hypothetical protein